MKWGLWCDCATSPPNMEFHSSATIATYRKGFSRVRCPFHAGAFMPEG